ncbi:hypothetical protein ILUMI_21729 [Ignelater luminosus]|uniref:Uncharacterized protein n=1 Tax=Ignelater luminosus TaxID=2038154 RepID=A0A8K0FXR6_IGNLU|nr:hypothetical protein ILUMI_21729 [Ignelater luminosus]
MSFKKFDPTTSFSRLLLGLKKVLFVGVYLLSLINLPYSLAAPAHQMAEGTEGILPEEWWINSLPFSSDPNLNNGNSSASTNDALLLEAINVQAASALDVANQIVDEYAVRVLRKRNFTEFYEEWRPTIIDEWTWLPTPQTLHKELHGGIDKSYLETLKVEDIGRILNNSYRYLQMTAVGLEQIVIDKSKEDFLYANFNQSRFKLRLVLTEIQNALVEHDMYSLSEDNLRMDSIPLDLRSLTTNYTLQITRDGVIFVSYINTLEYVIQVSDYLKNQLSQSS